MPPTKVKAPKETKAQLMEEIVAEMQKRYAGGSSSSFSRGAVEYLLNYFTSVDLVGIRDDLKRMENNGL